jgi:hypothetical protein
VIRTSRLLRRRERTRVDEAQVGSRQRCGAEQRRARPGRERAHALGGERLQAFRNRESPAVASTAALIEEPGDLQRVQRVPGRRLCDPDERRARKRPPQAPGDDPVQRGDRERPELEPLQAPRMSDAVEHVRVRRAQREERPDRLVRQPPERELDRSRRRRVEPLDVVDREHDLPGRGQLAEEREHRRSDQAPLRGTVGLDAEQRDVERVALRARKGGQRLLGDRRHEVGEPGEREPRLRLCRARHEHRGAAPARPPNGLGPERRLADPRLADDRKRAGAAVAVDQERLDDRELGLPSDDRRHGESVIRCQAPRLDSAS